jgi:hypothetical protein
VIIHRHSSADTESGSIAANQCLRLEKADVGGISTDTQVVRNVSTVSFEKLAAEIGSAPKSLIRMFGPAGNPQARNLFAVISHLQRDSGLTLHVTAEAL